MTSCTSRVEAPARIWISPSGTNDLLEKERICLFAHEDALLQIHTAIRVKRGRHLVPATCEVAKIKSCPLRCLKHDACKYFIKRDLRAFSFSWHPFGRDLSRYCFSVLRRAPTAPAGTVGKPSDSSPSLLTRDSSDSFCLLRDLRCCRRGYVETVASSSISHDCRTPPARTAWAFGAGTHIPLNGPMNERRD
jgi:hypothetical protein